MNLDAYGAQGGEADPNRQAGQDHSDRLRPEDGQMRTRSKFAKLAVLEVMCSLLLSLSTVASAESDAARAIRAYAATVPTNIPGIHTYAEPPKSFNPVNATDI
jgi:hypothetical protein